MPDVHTVAEWLRELVLPGLGTLVATAVFALLRKYIQQLSDERLRALLTELVRAAEQIYGPGRGADKRRYVTEQLRLQGVTDVPRHIIEAAVYDMSGDAAPAGN